MRPDNDANDHLAPSEPAATAWERTGGLPGLFQSSVPPVVLVTTHAWWGLHPAIVAALGAGVLITLLRAARRQPLRPAFGGFVGVAIAGALAARSGEARDFFLADIWWYCAAFAALTISIALRRPLVGVLWSATRGTGLWWRRDRRSLRRYDIATAVLAAVFAIRFAVTQRLYDHNEVGWLAVSKIAMNYPLWAAALVVAVWAGRQADQRHSHCRGR